MFWQKAKKGEGLVSAAGSIPEQVNVAAEGHFRSGKLHCAEAVLKAVKDQFRPELSDDLLQLAAGFGGGLGSGCLCGAVSGGTMALGLIRSEARKEAMALTRELHKWFHEAYGSSCCRVIRAHDKGVCPELTGAVAGKVAELLL